MTTELKNSTGVQIQEIPSSPPSSEEVDDPKLQNLSLNEENKLNSEADQKEEAEEEISSSISELPTDFSIKHPLQNRWTLWYDFPNPKTTQANWSDSLKRVVTFDSVEDFWRIFNNIRAASKLSLNSNYHLFKEHTEPKWEHADNVRGGKWIAVCKSGNRDQLDKMWLWTVLACIGENFEDENEICGCVVSIRKGQDRLALWTRTAHNDTVQRRIGAQLKKVLELPDNVSIGYQVHSDSMKRNSSFNNRPRYEL